MPSFDVVSEVDLQEVRNAVDQANREVGTRFDFKGVDARFELSEAEIKLHAEQEFQLNQMMDILRQKLVKRSRPAKSRCRPRYRGIRSGLRAKSATIYSRLSHC